jgi:hypothetical protein
LALQVSAGALIASSTPTELSSTGKLIDQILQSSAQSEIATQKTAMVQNAALMSQPAQLADALKQAISNSGLFYESHLADWARGKLPQSQLALEPQAMLNAMNVQDVAIDKNIPLSQLIHRQLDALEQQKISWQGNLIPGLPMEWQIQRKEKRQASPKNRAPEDTWQSVVKFEFASLGEVSATIHLQGKHLSLFLQTNSEASAALLKENASVLTNALIAAGTPLEAFSIKEND